MTFIQTKTKTIYPSTPRSQYNPVFPQPEHADCRPDKPLATCANVWAALFPDRGT